MTTTPAMTFPYTLDPFQRDSVEAIEKNQNVLVTAHTSAGKSTVAEYAIAKCARLGLKSIYTSPIKTLSNQKYADFVQHSSRMGLTPDQIGIMTGDVKLKPDASCLVMTTEILRNRLFQLDTRDDFFRDIKMVVFDEVHYINDPDRGHVWEETIMMLPPHILRIMLSASISGADRLADWVTSLHGRPTPLISTCYRPVPLIHQLFYDDPSYLPLPSNTTTDTHPLITIFQDSNFLPANSSRQFDNARSHYLRLRRRQSHNNGPNRHTLFRLVEHLHEQEQFPAIFFCFSRKKCQQYATAIPTVVVDHETRGNITRTFEFYLTRLLPLSQRSYPQVTLLKKTVERGIAFHHSGLLPALKEIVEILFSKGWIKILFATETFAVGVNMPARTVVFTSLEKHDSRSPRLLRRDEYIQMSGRAGRRGLDTLGRVIIAPLEDFPDRSDLHNLLTSSSPYISSRLVINPVLVLQAIDSPSFEIYSLLQKSLWYYQRQSDLENLETSLATEKGLHDSYTKKLPPQHLLERFEDYYRKVHNQEKKQQEITQNFENLGFAVKIKKKKKNKKTPSQQQESPLERLQREWPQERLFKDDWENYQKFQDSSETIRSLTRSRDSLQNEIYTTVQSRLEPLSRLGFLTLPPDSPDDSPPVLTITGKIAARFHECPPLMTSLAFQEDLFTGLTSVEIVAVLSVLSLDDSSTNYPLTIHNLDSESTLPDKTHRSSVNLKNALTRLCQIESRLVEQIDYPEHSLSRELLPYAISWAEGASLTTLREQGCDAYEGNLIRQFLKITHMAQEVIDVYSSLDLLDRVVDWDNIEKIMVRDFVKVESVYLS